MRNDYQIQQDVIAELRWDPAIAAAEIGVAARAGVVTLSGAVDSYARKHAAIRAAERVIGVKAIAEELRVLLPGHSNRTDTALAHAVLNALNWDVEVPSDRITVRVDEGWVWLEGSVEWPHQKAAAERAIRFLTGVRGVTNSLHSEARAFAPEIRKRIEDALTQNASADAKGISVETSDGTVTLRGSVRSWTERVDAVRVASSAPGVTRVNDQLVVHA